MSRHFKAHVETEEGLQYTSLVLTAVIVGIYGLEMAFPGLARDFALHVPTVWQEPWTMVTSLFLHSTSDYMHLLNNMYWLAIFGFILENIIGSKRFLALFLSAGLFANLAAFTFYPDSIVWGASGAISGIIAALAIIRPHATGLLYGIPAPMWLSLLGWTGSNIIQSTEILELLGATVSGADGGGTAFMAHIYGLGFGIIYGVFIRWKHSFHVVEEAEHELHDIEEDIREWERKHMHRNKD